MLSIHNVIKKPLLTEKAVNMKESMNHIVLSVDTRANKNHIKEAVERFFNVKVCDVRTMSCKGKQKRFGNNKGKRNDWKKAIVVLGKDERFEYV